MSNPNTNPNTLITTAISYVNGEPHIGHMYEMILADFITKWHKICLNSNVKLLTGTDEHGKKIQQIAHSLGIQPIDLCNINSNKFKNLANNVKMSYDHFIRTTDDQHIKFVQTTIETILKSEKLEKNSDIYLGSYEGYYSIREESYISESDAKLTDYKDPLTGKLYEIISEPSYYFKLASYYDFIKSNLNDNQPIMPLDLNNQLIDKLSELKLRDLSISRTTFDWGIKFPNTSDHIVYVWFDALLNYLSGADVIYKSELALGRLASDKIRPDKIIHIIGKDIVWFHAIIYPAILKSIGAESSIASNILVHGFITDEKGIKMSKSLNNVIYPAELLTEFPLDAIRYYLISETDLKTDFKFSKIELVTRYNNLLIKDFGNLVQRIFCLIKPILSDYNQYLESNSLNLINDSEQFQMDLNQMLKIYDIVAYNNYLKQLLSWSNKELSDKKPWLLKSSDELDNKLSILYQIMDRTLKATIMMYPIISSKSEEILSYFGLSLDNIYESNQIKIDLEKIKVFDQI